MIENLNIHLVGSLDAPIKEGDDPEGWNDSSLARVLIDGKVWFYDLPEGTTTDQFETAAVKAFNAYCWVVAEHTALGWMRVELDKEPMPDDFWDEEDEEDEEPTQEEEEFMDGVAQGFADLSAGVVENPFDLSTDATRHAGWKAVSESNGGAVEMTIPTKQSTS